MKKYITILVITLISCTKEKLKTFKQVNIKYYGVTTYNNDSTIIYKDSCLVRNDNKNQFWCYNYAFNILVKLDSFPQNKLNVEYKHSYFQTIKIKHKLK